MSFPARAYRVLIASPSDVKRERALAVEAIQHWNDVNSADRQIVLLPLRWETHAAPEYGLRPQAIINRQVADPADIVIGIFWTRIGSPTGIADSGTREEIERAAKEGKLVMLYFSTAPQDPDSIDIDQLSKLREFKAQTYPNALVTTYSDPTDFREKFFRQLDIQIRGLMSDEQENNGEGHANVSVTDIDLQFVGKLGEGAGGRSLKAETQYLKIANFQDFPDYTEAQASSEVGKLQGLLSGDATNKDYLRQKATQLVLERFYVPIGWWLKNRGGVGARDVFVELLFTQEDEQMSVLTDKDFPSDARIFKSYYAAQWSTYPSSPDNLIRQRGRFVAAIDLRALQPQREITPHPDIYIGALRSCRVSVVAMIYADTLSQPRRVELEIDFEVSNVETTIDGVVATVTRPVSRRRRRTVVTGPE